MGGSAARLPSTRNLVGLAGAQYASMLSTIFMPSLISLIVIERLGPVANAHFYVPTLIATGLSVVAMSIVRSFLVEASHEPHLLRKHAQSAMRALAVLLVPSVIIGCVFAPIYLRVFGAEYSAGGTTLIRLLLLAIPGSTVMVFYSAFAWLDQRVWWMSIRIFIGSVLQIAVILLLINRHGLLAIGIAALVNAGFTVIAFLPVSIRRYRETPKLTSAGVVDTIPEDVDTVPETEPVGPWSRTMIELSEEVSERSLWLNLENGPIFARLTTPVSGTTRGGILISPPIGSEGRVTRRTFRTFAMTMAAEGFSVLRFDHFGTGDSGGSLEEVGLSRALDRSNRRGRRLPSRPGLPGGVGRGNAAWGDHFGGLCEPQPAQIGVGGPLGSMCHGARVSARTSGVGSDASSLRNHRPLES